MDNIDFRKELEFYRDCITNDILPFWERYMDRENGGIFTCITNDGTTLVSTDKYVWSQGRFVWVLSKLADLVGMGIIKGDRDSYLDLALKTCRFIKENALLKEGGCAYLVTKDGRKLEAIASKGYHTSIFVDCFVAAGFAEYARVSGNHGMLEEAIRLFDFIEGTINSGYIPAEPFPIPDGYISQAVTMIMINVSFVLANALKKFNNERSKELFDKSTAYARDILTRFCREDNTIREFIHVGYPEGGTILERHVLPGHNTECMWFVIAAALVEKDYEMIKKASDIVAKCIEIGWDKEFGGLLRYVDKEGGKPHGSEIGAQYEALVKDTWDSKLWWTHSESLYATMLCYILTKENRFKDLYSRFFDYTFKVFPNRDKKTGEWIQIRDRKGQPCNKVVSLPVKDPYHIFRNMLLMVELLHNTIAAG